MSQEEAGFSSKSGNRYQPSNDALVKILKRFSITPVDSIIDLGCGKGKAMYLMSKFPFKEIKGYDLSKELVSIANENFEKLKIPQCRAVVSDATVYKEYDDFNYIYIFNSFPQEIFEIMMGNLLESLKHNPRVCRFIYLKLVCHDYIVDSTRFKLVYKKIGFPRWFDCYCYEYTP